jgi:CDP-glucose 4,6-dehydratase
VGGQLAAVEGLVIARDFWSGKRVLLTGHTGFKGGWLAMWLQRLGAQVMGYSLPAPTQPSLFESARISESIQGVIADIRDLQRLTSVFRDFSPEVVFHLAAQPLVRASYDDPVETYSTNLLGTVHVLEAVRRAKSVRSAVMVTTDKCYENRESAKGYLETDRLGGHDPYSNSKACAELAIDSYRRSFFSGAGTAAVASARAGNVIGGGDWAVDRLIPDLVRAAVAGKPLVLRNPKSTRPWQHVLEPLSGYLMLAQRLWDERARYAEAWNFGPRDEDDRTVENIVALAARRWGDKLKWTVDDGPRPHETVMLKLDCSKAASVGWRPLLRVDQAVDWTSEWYRAWHDKRDVKALAFEQIERYSRLFEGERPA